MSLSLTLQTLKLSLCLSLSHPPNAQAFTVSLTLQTLKLSVSLSHPPNPQAFTVSVSLSPSKPSSFQCLSHPPTPQAFAVSVSLSFCLCYLGCVFSLFVMGCLTSGHKQLISMATNSVQFEYEYYICSTLHPGLPKAFLRHSFLIFSLLLV